MQNYALEGFKISSQQKRLWLLQQKSNSQPYRVQCAVLIEGDIQLSILEQAVKKLVDRYEILRTNFQVLKGMAIPLQIIKDHTLAINLYDFNDREAQQQQAEVENLFQKQNQLIFDEQNGYVLDICLVKLSRRQYILLIAIPAICADQISIYNLVREISETYSACLDCKEIVNEPLQYADIAAWQDDLFTGEDAEIAKEYWRKQNLFNLDIAQLPSEKPFWEKSEFNPKFISINIHHDTVANIEALACTNATSVSTILMTCWYILLWRLTGAKMAIAMCCDGRNYEELKSALGLLAKYIPVGSELDENYKFLQLLKQLDKKITDTYQWQESFSWEEIVDGDGMNQELSFFPFAFDFTSQPTQYLADCVSFSIYKQYACIDRFNVKLSCHHWNGSLTAELHYNANIFDKEDIERLAAQFQTLLVSAIHNPEIVISQLEILSAKERQQLLTEFNQTKNAPPPYQSIHQWFETQANKTPDNVAVAFEDQQLTYQQLNTKANKVAERLASLGVKPEVIVALYVERSVDLVIGILGILKAGGAYLPLEPMPSEALALRLQDAQVPVVLTQKHLISEVNPLPPIVTQVQVVYFDTETSDAISEKAVLHTASKENLAYVIYTSGSTGKPKGVAVEHRQLLNYLNGILEKLNLPAGASFATVSTFAADLGNTAIFSTLCTGGCLHIISRQRATNPIALADYCSRHRIDCLKIVPSHLSALLGSGYAEQILPRQRLILGGEACNWELIEQVQQYAPNCQVFNHYGPTETTVGVLTYAVELASVPSKTKSEKVPLGRPLANTQIYLLDKYQQPVPLDVPGEIYIGGDSVARGYLNQPEITAKKFIQNTFSNSAGARLYRTGDLARYRCDGNIEFLGRVDNQVKLHGFRIELGEIETVLSQHPEVREVVVLARQDQPGQTKLVAYVVPQQRSPVNLNDLKSFLQQKLPEYMVPSKFLQLKSLPLTSNGKVDRKSLPSPDQLRPELEATYFPPQNDLERIIATIWQEMLRVEKVGIHDNFFELGGHSLLLIQLSSKLQTVLNRTVSVNDIFQYPTINSLAKYLSQEEPEQSFLTESGDRAEMRRKFMHRQVAKKK